MKTIEELGEDAERARASFDDAAAQLRAATRRLRKLERQRSRVKTEAALRLVQVENPGTPGKQYSFSQACDFAQLDPVYFGYKEDCDAAELQRLHAEQDLQSAHLAAELANNLVRASVGAGL